MKPTETQDARYRIRIAGMVQGVGYRPFVYRLARELGLRGFVANTTRGVVIDAEGPPAKLDLLLRRLDSEKPAPSRPSSPRLRRLSTVGYQAFEVRASESRGIPSARVSPDLATCADCVRELFDPGDRRFRYPFSSCSHCGPRFTIVESVPYDRARTTMRRFALCTECRREFEDPTNRRYRAEPIACPDCGPRLEFVSAFGRSLGVGESALQEALGQLASGAILAVKGVGGYHLMVDARNEPAVRRLRERKGRPEKPFALLFPDVPSLYDEVELDATEQALIESPAAPIVLLRKRAASALAGSVAPGCRWLGCLIPSNPLQHLLMRELGFALVATSGNLSDEPLCTDDRQALERLGGIADGFLMHDRPIAHPADDSLARVVAGRPLYLRLGRGIAPWEKTLHCDLGERLAVGGHLKSTIAVSRGRKVVMSQHLGDLGSEASGGVFRTTVQDLVRRTGLRAQEIACDAHPDYASSRYARATGRPVVAVQHHEAHFLSVLVDNDRNPPALAVAWDGSGLGDDGTLWGGECFRLTVSRSERVASLLPFPLPGGEAAMREGRRALLGLLHAGGFDPSLAGFPEGEGRILSAMLRRQVGSPLTSSVGRLFDAVAALLGACARSSFEGQAASRLEDEAGAIALQPPFAFSLADARLDWRPMLGELILERARGTSRAVLASRFHATLVEMLVSVARRSGERHVLLSGGCFQNRLLLEAAIDRLRREGFEPLWPRDLPPGDGGLALGQLVAAALRRQGSFPCA